MIRAEQSLTILLAGGRGERLHPLTENRAKPAVPFAGVYRIIDFTLSNCLNSGLRRIFVLTQYKSQSLNRHISLGWDRMAHELDEFIEVVPPQMKVGMDWYRGTADAVHQNLNLIERDRSRYVFILSGDHVYKMDYSLMLDFHRENQADLTVAALEVPLAEASRFGILQVDEQSRLYGFQEKPEEPTPLPSNSGFALASMGVYIFSRDVLMDVLSDDAGRADTSHDFGKDIIPRLVDSKRVFCYNFRDENKKEAKYWRDIGTIAAYFEANMDLVSVEPFFNLYDESWPIRTLMPQAPPAKFVFSEGARVGVAVDSIVSPGCIVSGGRVSFSVLSPHVRVRSYCSIESSILFPRVQVGRHSRLRRVIVESDVQIPEGEEIGFDQARDKERFVVTPEGITVVSADAFR